MTPYSDVIYATSYLDLGTDEPTVIEVHRASCSTSGSAFQGQ
jgi:hypothetical protein